MCDLKAIVEKLDVPEGAMLLVTLPEHADKDHFDRVEEVLLKDSLCKGVTFLLMPYDHKVSIVKKADVNG